MQTDEAINQVSSKLTTEGETTINLET